MEWDQTSNVDHIVIKEKLQYGQNLVSTATKIRLKVIFGWIIFERFPKVPFIQFYQTFFSPAHSEIIWGHTICRGFVFVALCVRLTHILGVKCLACTRMCRDKLLKVNQQPHDRQLVLKFTSLNCLLNLFNRGAAVTLKRTCFISRHIINSSFSGNTNTMVLDFRKLRRKHIYIIFHVCQYSLQFSTLFLLYPFIYLYYIYSI